MASLSQMPDCGSSWLQSPSRRMSVRIAALEDRTIMGVVRVMEDWRQISAAAPVSACSVFLLAGFFVPLAEYSS